jgi:hypothetical protein
MMSDQQFTPVVGRKSYGAWNRVQTESSGADGSMGITDLNPAVVPGFRRVKGKETVCDFNYP